MYRIALPVLDSILDHQPDKNRKGGYLWSPQLLCQHSEWRNPSRMALPRLSWTAV